MYFLGSQVVWNSFSFQCLEKSLWENCNRENWVGSSDRNNEKVRKKRVILLFYKKCLKKKEMFSVLSSLSSLYMVPMNYLCKAIVWFTVFAIYKLFLLYFKNAVKNYYLLRFILFTNYWSLRCLKCITKKIWVKIYMFYVLLFVINELTIKNYTFTFECFTFCIFSSTF